MRTAFNKSAIPIIYPVIGKTYFQPDIYGSPLFASNEQGQVLSYAERNIWGSLRLPVHNDLNISGIEDSLRFTSYAYDPVIGKYFAQARFYDSRQGRMLSKDPIKRDINGYPYCNNDPVNCVDPTGEIANVLIGGAIGGLVGGAFGYANSAVSQLMSGKGFDSGKAWGAAANGAIVGAVKGAVAGSGVGLPLAIAADFAAGTIGSAVEQGISEGVVDVGKSIAGGLTNAVNGLIYGNDTLRSLGQAAVKGAASGALTSGINYLADVTGPQPAARRSPGIQYQGGAAGMFRPRDPKRGCVPSDPSIGSLRYGRDYGYQYNVPASGEESQSRRGFSLWDFGKEVVLGAVTGGMAGATFYGAGRAVSALKESIKGGSATRNRIGNPIEPMEKTYEMALNPELQANEVAAKYGINLRGSGQKIKILYNSKLASAGKTRVVNPTVIEIGPNAFVNEEELANTIAHELNHSRSFLKGGTAPEWGQGGAYPAGDALAAWIRGER